MSVPKISYRNASEFEAWKFVAFADDLEFSVGTCVPARLEVEGNFGNGQALTLRMVERDDDCNTIVVRY